MIVTWNGREDTLRALEQVHAQARQERGVKIVVVDNGSSDGTADEIGRRFPDVEPIRLVQNRGFTGGVAAGVERSSADQIILLNNDAVPEAGWLAEMRRSLETAPSDVVAIGGKITDSHGKLTDFIGGILTFDGHAFQKDFRRPLETVEPPVDGSEMLFACGGNMIARRREFVALARSPETQARIRHMLDSGKPLRN